MDKGFDFVIGNPPYSVLTGKSEHRTSKPVYPDFQVVTSLVGEVSSLIYPASWRTLPLKGLLFDPRPAQQSANHLQLTLTSKSLTSQLR